MVRPVMEPVQAEMEPPGPFLQIDMFRQGLVQGLVQGGDVDAGTAPFPRAERESDIHEIGISQGGPV